MNEFIMPEKIITGGGSVNSLEKLLYKYGTKALIVTGKSSAKHGSLKRIESTFSSAGIPYVVYTINAGEPTDETVMNGLGLYKSNNCDFLLALGGGSVLDTMKAIAVLSVNSGELYDYMNKEITSPLPPMIAVPTTLGTGSEVTRFTIITDTKRNIKMLLKGNSLVPNLAVVDYELSISMPQRITASTGLDALTHSIEAYTSKKSQPLSDTFALSAIKRIFKYLPYAYQNDNDRKAREEMSYASLEAGIAFNNSSVTLVHGMSRPIGALFHIPHGMSNAILLNVCLTYAADGTYERFGNLGRIIGAADDNASDKEAAEAFLQSVRNLCAVCEIPTLEKYGIDKTEFFEQIDKMAEDAVESGSPSNTIKYTDKKTITALYKSLWEE